VLLGSSIADNVLADHDLSFTLGVTPTSPLQLANVGTTLASDGMFCPPTPITAVVSAAGAPVPLRDVVPCHRAMPAAEARSLAHALGRDAVIGTSADAAQRAGWTRPVSAKTGTTQHSESTAFVGFTEQIAGAAMVFDDTADPGPLCRARGTVEGCSTGDLFGGQAGGLTWYRAVGRILDGSPATPLPPVAPDYEDGRLTS
jgi:membrane peptidoglycan carboxypeptidase